MPPLGMPLATRALRAAARRQQAANGRGVPLARPSLSAGHSPSRAAAIPGARTSSSRRDKTREDMAPPGLSDSDAELQLSTEALLQPAVNRAWQVVLPEHFRYVSPPADWDAQIDALQTRIGVRFRDVTHLKCALTHSGAFQLNALPADVPAHRLANRSLEFLGDSLLGLAAAAFVFQSRPAGQEGRLTVAKAALVNNRVLSRVCERHLKLHELILVAQDYSLQRRSASPKFTRGRDTIQAGAVEALIAAVYLDQGLDAALAFVNTHVLPHAVAIATEKPKHEPISALQSLLQAHTGAHPVYKHVTPFPSLCISRAATRTANDAMGTRRHLPKPIASDTFQVALVVKGQTILTGSGASYKEARVDAAEAGYALYAPLLSARDA